MTEIHAGCNFYCLYIFNNYVFSDTSAKYTTQLTQDNSQQKTSRTEPYPLPMPAYGGYYAPLYNYMPADGPLAINNLQRFEIF